MEAGTTVTRNADRVVLERAGAKSRHLPGTGEVTWGWPTVREVAGPVLA